MVNTSEDDEKQQGKGRSPTGFYWLIVILVIIGLSIGYSSLHGPVPANQSSEDSVPVP